LHDLRLLPPFLQIFFPTTSWWCSHHCPSSFTSLRRSSCSPAAAPQHVTFQTGRWRPTTLMTITPATPVIMPLQHHAAWITAVSVSNKMDSAFPQQIISIVEPAPIKPGSHRIVQIIALASTFFFSFSALSPFVELRVVR
jgi:hypothetical protein